MIVDEENNELLLKLVYFGPGLAGKSSNLQYAFSRTAPEHRTKMTSLATETERVLWFTLRPQTLAPIGGKTIRLSLHTVPGAVFYDVSRTPILQGVDGLVFVADSQRERIEANVESMEQLKEYLESHDRCITEVPLVIQYNKRDLPNRMPLFDLDRALNLRHLPHFDAVASTGSGVFDTLKAVTKQVCERILFEADGHRMYRIVPPERGTPEGER